MHPCLHAQVVVSELPEYKELELLPADPMHTPRPPRLNPFQAPLAPAMHPAAAHVLPHALSVEATTSVAPLAQQPTACTVQDGATAGSSHSPDTAAVADTVAISSPLDQLPPAKKRRAVTFAD